jgi:hypothetical protein
MPDRMYRLRAGESLVYDVAFKRKDPDLHAIPSGAPAVHVCEVRVTKSRDEPETLTLASGGSERDIALGDVLSPVYAAVREIVAEVEGDRAGDLGLEDCALIFALRS